MKLRIEIELGNDAMRDPWDVLGVLEHMLKRKMPEESRYFTDKDGCIKPFATRNIYDNNGNQVGHIVCKED